MRVSTSSLTKLTWKATGTPSSSGWNAPGNTLVVDRDPIDLAEQLFDVGHGDYVPEVPNPPLVHVLQVASIFLGAIAAAVHAIESVGLAATELKSEDLVSAKEVATRLGRTYEVAATNHVIRARRILTGDQLRAEMAQLMSA